MSVPAWLRRYPHAASICRIAGFCLFVLAFFLPACERPFTLGHRKSAMIFPGWECAEATLSATPELIPGLSAPDPYWERLIVAMSGWVNPLVVAVLALCFSPKLRKVRRGLAAAAVFCILATWVEFYIGGFTPLIGHFLWIAGALLILAPDAVLETPRTAADEIPAPSKA